jgi:hypothetical protein
MGCAVTGCGRLAATRGWCSAHYARWLRTGDPGPAEIRSIQPHDRNPAQSCGVEGCARPYKARGYCNAHLTRWYQYGDPRADQPIGPPPVRNPDSYWSVHERIRRERGSATTLTCTDCGAAARDWSYDWTDPHEKTDPARGYRYSTNPARYVPRCRSCHRRATRRGHLPRDADHVAQLYHDGHTIAGIAQLTGHSRAEIRRTLTDHGLTIKQAHKRQRHTHP